MADFLNIELSDILTTLENLYLVDYKNGLCYFSDDLKSYKNINNDSASYAYINPNGTTDWIYYIVADQFYRVQPDGSGWEVLANKN